MLFRPPREKQSVSWLFVAAWTLIIYVTIPLARTIQKYVAQHWGRELFTYAVLVIILIALATSVYLVIRHHPISRHSFIWQFTVAVIFVGYTINLSQGSPEEATHFVQYGILGVLVYRALTHRVRDVSIYFSSAVICGTIGMLDEFIQWMIPGRFWGLRDIWFNFFAGALVQIGIAKGLKPDLISDPPNRSSIRILCTILLVAVVILGASLLNTPQRIKWYSQRIPFLDFLLYNQSVMIEFGYLYREPEKGLFKSRFTREELRLLDRQRAREAAWILNKFRGEDSYGSLLKIYTPITDPFVHEARVHLYSRDRNFIKSFENQDEPKKYKWHLTAAWHENRFMETYFSNTLSASSYHWPDKFSELASRHAFKKRPYESRVSRDLITRFTEGQVALFFLALILVLSMVVWRLGKR